MPPELPQTCSCPRHPVSDASFALGAGRVRGAPSPRQATTNRVLVLTPKHYGTNAWVIPGFTIERRRTER